jgi:single-strand DNA-binding protein
MRGQTNEIMQLSVATSERWLNKQTGEYDEKTQWHTVVVFNPHVVSYVSKYAHKGDLVCVEGQIETRKWDRSAQGLEDKFYTEIVVKQFGGNVQVLPKADRGAGEDREQPEQRAATPRQTATKAPAAATATKSKFDDDEIPFAPEWR